MNNILRDHISGRRLRTENKGQRPLRNLASLDFQIFMNDIQRIHLLPFVLVKPLDLDIKNGIRIKVNTFHLLHISHQFLLLCPLDLGKLIQYRRILFKGKQLFQLIRILLVALSDQARNISRQFPVAGQQPSSEGDTVGLVVELLRIKFIKIMELRVFQNLRVDRRHAVHGKAVVDIDVRHVHLLVLVDDPYIFVLRIFLPYLLIQFLNNRHKLRHHFLQIFQRPFFQRLRQDRVICVSAGFAHHIDRLVHGKRLILHQYPDQFRDDHGGMGIIDLDHTVIIELSQILLLFFQLLQNKLRAVADHKILLIDSEKISRLIGIIGI